MEDIPVFAKWAGFGLCFRPTKRALAWLIVQRIALLNVVLMILPLTVSAANLQPQTLKAWKEHIDAAFAQMQERLNPDRSFLSTD